MRILDQAALGEAEYLACLSAFCSALANHLAEAENYLVRLAGKRKGAHFGWEMAMDRARYSALIVLDRWSDLNTRFSESLQRMPSADISEAAAPKCETAAASLQAAYASIDQLEEYSEIVVQEAGRRFRRVLDVFEAERSAAAAAGERFAGERPVLAVLGSPASAGEGAAEIFRRTRDEFLADLNRR